MTLPLPPELPGHREIHLGFRFGVFFFIAGVIPNPVDIRFQKVKGLSLTVRTTPVTEGGQNIYTQQLPVAVEHGNLVLERGMVIGSPLIIEFNATMSLFQFTPSNVIVMLFNEESIPIASWLFMNAFPVRWSLSDLDATEKSILIDTLELSYARMQTLRI
ncbi:MAG: phage tail protein [Polyangiaceae bacterium]|nr:phage tail protein [Polyangiaceae bacterium]